jgi:hypothetical protein
VAVEMLGGDKIVQCQCRNWSEHPGLGAHHGG